MTPERADHIMHLVQLVVAAECRYTKALHSHPLDGEELHNAREHATRMHRSLAQVIYGMVEYSKPDSFQADIDRGAYGDINEQQTENSEETKNA